MSIEKITTGLRQASQAVLKNVNKASASEAASEAIGKTSEKLQGSLDALAFQGKAMQALNQMTADTNKIIDKMPTCPPLATPTRVSDIVPTPTCAPKLLAKFKVGKKEIIPSKFDNLKKFNIDSIKKPNDKVLAKINAGKEAMTELEQLNKTDTFSDPFAYIAAKKVLMERVDDALDAINSLKTSSVNSLPTIPPITSLPTIPLV